MTFTYTSDFTVARDYVRFHTGQTVEAESLLSDEEITSLVAVEGSNNLAVRAGLLYIIRRFSQPNFRADWLQVDYKTAREGYKQMLEEWDSATSYGLLATSITTPYRQDSTATAVPDWTNGRGPGNDTAGDDVAWYEYTGP